MKSNPHQRLVRVAAGFTHVIDSMPIVDSNPMTGILLDGGPICRGAPSNLEALDTMVGDQLERVGSDEGERSSTSRICESNCGASACRDRWLSGLMKSRSSEAILTGSSSAICCGGGRFGLAGRTVRKPAWISSISGWDPRNASGFDWP